MSMKKKHISYSNTGRFSKIIIDYLSKEQTLDPFYSKSLSTNNLKIQAKKKIKVFSGLNRKILVKNIKTQYKNVEISKAVKKNLDLLYLF